MGGPTGGQNTFLKESSKKIVERSQQQNMGGSIGGSMRGTDTGGR